MRLSPAIDLAPIRAEAVERLDRAFAIRLAPSPLFAAHAEKERRARRLLHLNEVDVALAAEAEGRGIAPRDLAARILAAADDARDALMAGEAARQAAKARIAAAPDQHAIRAILAEIDIA